MAVGAYLGAQVGSMLAVRLGARLIRLLLVTVACAMAVRLLSDPANPVRMALAGADGRLRTGRPRGPPRRARRANRHFGMKAQ